MAQRSRSVRRPRARVARALATGAPEMPPSWHLAALEIERLFARGLTGNGIRIGVVDTGVEPEHPQLQDRDLHVLDIRGDAGDGHDHNGHGTEMVGLLVGRQGSIAPRATVISVKAFMAGPFGTADDIAAGVRTALDAGVDILSLSVGTPEATAALTQVVRDAISNGVLVLAAGENGDDATPLFPAALTPVMAVTAATRDNTCLFDGLPSWLDVAGPGVDLLTSTRNGLTGLSTGTSPATAACAGVCALLLELASRARRRELAGRLLGFLTATGTLPTNATDPDSPRVLAPDAAANAIEAWLGDSLTSPKENR